MFKLGCILINVIQSSTQSQNYQQLLDEGKLIIITNSAY